MKVEQRINGAMHFELTPTTPLEQLQATEMLRASEKGKTVSIAALRVNGEVVGIDVSVEC